MCVVNHFFVWFSGEVFEVVKKEVAAMLKGRILVGHALRNDLKVLGLGALLWEPHSLTSLSPEAPLEGLFHSDFLS